MSGLGICSTEARNRVIKIFATYAEPGSTVRSVAFKVSLWCAALMATVLAPMIAVSLRPSPTLLNELVALAGWAILALLLGFAMRGRVITIAHAAPMWMAGGALILGIVASAVYARSTLPTLIGGIGSVLALMAIGLLGLAARQGGYLRATLTALSFGWTLLGLLSTAVACVQVFLPELISGYWVSGSPEVGRAYGNIRQPNQLATMMIWACISVVWLGERGLLRRGLVLSLLTAFVFTVVLSASRMGLLGILMLFFWGLLDRQLSRAARLSLLLTVLMLATSWWLMGIWASSGEHVFGAANRIGDGAAKSTRYTLWAHSIELIKQHPLTGVGWHAFNLEWTFGHFTGRSNEYFDHAHNLPLHLMVELGVPIGLSVTGLLCWALIRAFLSASDEPVAQALDRRCAFMMVAMLVVHSLLEFPLWYLHLSLPVAFYLGLCLGQHSGQESVARASLPGRALILAGFWVGATGLAMFADYMRVAVIYRPSANDLPLVERMERAQSAWVFGPLADYAFATNYPPGPDALRAAKQAARHYIDPQLMIVWATALHATGDDERASYLVNKLREFPSPLAWQWLEPCDVRGPEGEEAHFQCAIGRKEFTIDEMLR